MALWKKILGGLAIAAVSLLLLYSIYMLMQPPTPKKPTLSDSKPYQYDVPAPTDTKQDINKIQVYDPTVYPTQELYQQDLQSSTTDGQQYVQPASTKNTSAGSNTASTTLTSASTTTASTPESTASTINTQNALLINDVLGIGKEIFSQNKLYKFTLTWLGNLEVSKINSGVTNEWTGFYKQNGAQYDMTFKEFIVKDFKITGSGSDTVASFTINGDIKPTGYVSFIKQYQGMHAVQYTGYLANNYINGWWNLNGMSDQFQIYKKVNDVVWTSNTYGQGDIKQAKLTNDGLQLQNSGGGSVWNSSSSNLFKSRKQQPAMVVMQDDGSLVIVNSQKAILFDITKSISNQLRTSQTMFPGQMLKAKDCEIYLYFTPGGLFQFFLGNPQSGGKSYAQITDSPSAMITLQDDGNLVAYNANGSPVWASNTNGYTDISNLTLQNDGNLVLNDYNGGYKWAIDIYFRNTISTNETIQQGVALKANQLPFMLYLHKNGNLCLYQDFVSETSLGTLLWQSSSQQSAALAPVLKLTEYGLSLQDNGKEYWKQALKGCNSLELSNDRNLYIYDSNSQVVWKSGTSF